ncbi:MAG: hypothetical protein ACI8WB_000291 [Phenylobacterium sp.]|jgi:hypothetical protein
MSQILAISQTSAMSQIKAPPAIITLNDCNLSLTVAGKTWYSSGFATLTTNGPVFGEQAQQQARLQPLVSFNQFWNQLSLEPIQHATAKFRHYADFAYHQLLHLHQQADDFDEVIFCIPASFSREQLSLLLGICQSCPFNVVGLVDHGVATVTNQASAGRHLYLDIQLHQCVISEINVDSGVTNEVQLGRQDIVAGTGLINLYKHWARYLCDQFIQQCRFDPMHDANIEQQLYDLLPSLIGHSQEETELTLQGKQVKLNRQSLMRHSLSLFDPVLGAIEHFGPCSQLFISERVAAIPELSSRLNNTQANTQTNVQVVNDAITVQNTLNASALICVDSEQLAFTTTLPATTAQPSAVAEKTAIKAHATHLLSGHQAWPIGDKTIYININNGIELSTQSQAKAQAQFALSPQSNPQTSKLELSLLNGSKVWINGQQGSHGSQLHHGDQLSFNKEDIISEQSLTLINVIEDTHW